MRRETRGREGGIRQEGRKVGGELDRGKQAGRQINRQTDK